jgi:hypothetical protein
VTDGDEVGITIVCSSSIGLPRYILYLDGWECNLTPLLCSYLLH